MVSSIEYGCCLLPCTAHGETTCSSSNSKTAVISACFWSESYDFILKRLKTPKYISAKETLYVMLCNKESTKEKSFQAESVLQRKLTLCIYY